MGLTADVLIVAWNDDAVARHLSEVLESRGRVTQCMDGPTAARLFTVRVTKEHTTVEPQIPMFVRPSAWWYEEASTDADERFLRAEAYAAFWAAAALSPAPALNRPGRNGPAVRMTWGTLGPLTAWCGVNGDRETYVSGPELLQGQGLDETLWGEDVMWLTAPVNQLRPEIPLRARKLNPHAGYEIVTVVGQRGFAATADPLSAELGLVERSIALAQKSEVAFATVTWAVDETGATPVRLNAAPDEQEVRYVWPEVADALCEELLK
jgi:hypothetical protein